MHEDPVLGGTALLRVAGMPLESWAAAGDPHLFAQVAEQARSDERRTERVRALAERLGETVVPHPALTPADRHAVLALRRRLHSGTAPGPAEVRLLDRLPVARPLAEEAARLSCETESAATARQELANAVTAERERVGALVWAMVCASPVMRAFLDETDPGISADISRRLAAGETWSGKRLYKRGAYLWRALGRAAAKTTPRGWAGQVTQLPVTSAEGDGTGAGDTPVSDPSPVREADPHGRPLPRLVPPGTVLGALAAESVENVHRVRARLAGLDLRAAGPATLLAPAPLHFLQPAGTPTGPGVLRCWVIDPHEHDRLREVVLRRTRPLERVLALLSDGPRPLGDVEATLLGTAAIRAAVPGPAVLRGFLAHLVELGVLQVCAGPRRHATDWFTAEDVLRLGAPPRPHLSPGAPPRPHLSPGAPPRPRLSPGTPPRPRLSPGTPPRPRLSPGTPPHQELAPGTPLRPRLSPITESTAFAATP
ncbi:lantibiotic dehydratase, partial [Streptomyces sp. SID161]|nr:lantibiotic dehydratase [Streptomyces sp. SID161]